MNAVLLSYPRSGNTWIRYCAEYLTKRPTRGLNKPLDQPIGSQVSIGVDLRAPLILLKRHSLGIIANDESLNYPGLILILRNYKECIVRHRARRKKTVEGLEMLLNNNRGPNRTIRADYISNIMSYESWSRKKHLVYYEDLITDPKTEITKVMNFLGYKNQKGLDDFMSNLGKHKEESIKIYGGHASKRRHGWLGSHTGGTPLIFHSYKLAPSLRKSWDQTLEAMYPYLYTKYLLRYKE